MQRIRTSDLQIVGKWYIRQASQVNNLAIAGCNPLQLHNLGPLLLYKLVSENVQILYMLKCLVEPGMKIPVFRRFCLLEAKKDSFRRKHTFFCLFFLLGTFYNQMFILFYSAVRFHIQFNKKSIFYFFDCLIFISLF